MSEDAHFSGDEPLFAVNNQRVEHGPGYTIYTCPRCGSDRKDGMKCQHCEQPDKRYAYQRPGYNPALCPCCGYGVVYGSTKEAATCQRCGLPLAEYETFREPRAALEVPTEFDHALLNGMKIKWDGDDREAKASA